MSKKVYNIEISYITCEEQRLKCPKDYIDKMYGKIDYLLNWMGFERTMPYEIEKDGIIHHCGWIDNKGSQTFAEWWIEEEKWMGDE